MNKLNIKLKRFDKSLPLPEYKTAGAACFDVSARITITIEPKQIGYIPLNISLEIPEGYWVMLAARSSTHKQGLMPANGTGIGDHDFSGDADEYHFAAYNFTNKTVVVERGTRIAQMMVLPVPRIKFTEVDTLNNSTRGGFGTTGNK